jgi:hypothetical protein
MRFWVTIIKNDATTSKKVMIFNICSQTRNTLKDAREDFTASQMGPKRNPNPNPKLQTFPPNVKRKSKVGTYFSASFSTHAKSIQG